MNIAETRERLNLLSRIVDAELALLPMTAEQIDKLKWLKARVAAAAAQQVCQVERPAGYTTAERDRTDCRLKRVLTDLHEWLENEILVTR